MNPATPVTTQTLGADSSCARRWGYGAEITCSQWRCTRRQIQGSRAREHVHSILRAACRGILATRQSIFHSQHTAMHAIHKSCRDSVLPLRKKTCMTGKLPLCRDTAPFCGRGPTEPVRLSLSLSLSLFAALLFIARRRQGARVGHGRPARGARVVISPDYLDPDSHTVVECLPDAARIDPLTVPAATAAPRSVK